MTAAAEQLSSCGAGVGAGAETAAGTFLTFSAGAGFLDAHKNLHVPGAKIKYSGISQDAVTAASHKTTSGG